MAKNKIETSDIRQTGLDKAISWLGEKLSVIFLIIVAITFFEVFVRYVLNSPTIWVHETAMFLGGCLFIFGGAYALAIDKHVRVVLLYDNVSPKVRAYLNLFHHLMGFIFSVAMTYAAYRMAYESWFKPWGALQLETSGTAWNTYFPAYLKAVILITMFLISLQFFLKFIKELYLICGGKNV